MTFDEVMKKVQEKGNENQEKLKKAILDDIVNENMAIGIFCVHKSAEYRTFVSFTAEQFLKIYEILGE